MRFLPPAPAAGAAPGSEAAALVAVTDGLEPIGAVVVEVALVAAAGAAAAAASASGAPILLPAAASLAACICLKRRAVAKRSL